MSFFILTMSLFNFTCSKKFLTSDLKFFQRVKVTDKVQYKVLVVFN